MVDNSGFVDVAFSVTFLLLLMSVSNGQGIVIFLHFVLSEWPFVRDWTHRSTGYSSCTSTIFALVSRPWSVPRSPRVRVRVGLGTSFRAYNITHTKGGSISNCCLPFPPIIIIIIIINFSHIHTYMTGVTQ